MDQTFLAVVAVGFIAQMIDGALGMAYGLSSTAFLLSLNVPPAPASAAVHTAEMVVSGVSGLAHLRFGNVDRGLFQRLVLPGVIGGALGASLLSALPGERIKPFVSAYLLAMGVYICYRAAAKSSPKPPRRSVAPLGLAGGFFDAIGGGGWGPIVTTHLVADGHEPRLAVGSVNLAEFFVTVAEAGSALLGRDDPAGRHELLDPLALAVGTRWRLAVVFPQGQDGAELLSAVQTREFVQRHSSTPRARSYACAEPAFHGRRRPGAVARSQRPCADPPSAKTGI